MKRTVILSILGIVLLMAVFIVPPVLYGQSRPVTLAAAPPLSGEVAQALGVTNGKLPVPGQDFNLTDVHYFANGQWAAATIQEPSVGNAYVVLENRGGMYQVVLGPGTQFDPSYKLALPAALNQYLQGKGIF